MDDDGDVVVDVVVILNYKIIQYKKYIYLSVYIYTCSMWFVCIEHIF